MYKEARHEKLMKEVPLANWPWVDIKKQECFFDCSILG
jgi:hypothetical protein